MPQGASAACRSGRPAFVVPLLQRSRRRPYPRDSGRPGRGTCPGRRGRRCAAGRLENVIARRSRRDVHCRRAVSLDGVDLVDPRTLHVHGGRWAEVPVHAVLQDHLGRAGRRGPVIVRARDVTEQRPGLGRQRDGQWMRPEVSDLRPVVTEPCRIPDIELTSVLELEVNAQVDGSEPVIVDLVDEAIVALVGRQRMHADVLDHGLIRARHADAETRQSTGSGDRDAKDPERPEKTTNSRQGCASGCRGCRSWGALQHMTAQDSAVAAREKFRRARPACTAGGRGRQATVRYSRGKTRGWRLGRCPMRKHLRSPAVRPPERTNSPTPTPASDRSRTHHRR